MPHPKFLRRVLLAIALAWPATLLYAQTPMPSTEADATSLAGQLLVASPEMGDDRFAETVILVVRHGKDGAFGIVINRPVEDHPIAELLKSMGQSDDGVEGSLPIFAGGPVQEEVGFVLHSAEYHREGTIAVTDRVSLTSNAAVLRDIGHHHGPNKVLIAFGYAGWSPGQLERELAQHAWATTAADPALVFDADRSQVWDLAWARRSINL
jgi:putative transcriptional regulator